MKTALKYILIITIITLNLYSKETLLIATVDLDHSLRANEPMRKEFVRTINRFAYLKQKTSISVDREKKKLFSTNKLSLEDGLTVASNLKVQAVIIMDSEKVLKATNTNNNNNNNNNITINSNDINTMLSNYNITNTMLSNDIVLTNEIKDLGDLIEYGIGEKTENIDKDGEEKSDEELYEIRYNFKVIDMATGDTLKEYKLKNQSESVSILQEICTYLEFHLSNLLFKSMESPINGIYLNFRIERITLENKTNVINNQGEIIEGESFTLNFRSNAEGYLYIFAFQNDGNVILMFPNDFNNFIKNKYKNKIEARKNYVIPPENSKFNIKIRPPFGEDAFYCLYTKKEQQWIRGEYFKGDGFQMCQKNKIGEFTDKLKYKLKFINSNDWHISKVYLKSISETK
ncbi:hypothetical protein BHAMNSH16_03425 [Brachyspira hampsonii]|uniref:DUF4384 domain-containing protein n=1 Tax=Brachyspira hampsonii TaxID=1287055 RepID=A0AAC9TQ70_9SPIR|nr:DUF4384 domain-containing protein [Brachyspira hampsonii]ASJ20750.1 hypothetical protein BHAMNSH16_03425 [Brachyspira hampsonii]MBW5381152.1 DUF4384 domain-containing protein [Brachyspira hampsonii]MBW5410937.1 DUF4384 domain-containing protein [Brachyspira hampsonii]OEJ14276.1 hypothetical protein A9496_01890 [Brachyspira hampsonii]